MLDIDALAEPRTRLLIGVLRSALGVVLKMYEPNEFDARSRNHIPVWERIHHAIEDEALSTLTGDEAQACLDALHAAQYALGPTELHTVTGYTLREYASAGLLLFSALEMPFRTYDLVLWSEEGERL